MPYRSGISAFVIFDLESERKKLEAAGRAALATDAALAAKHFRKAAAIEAELFELAIGPTKEEHQKRREKYLQWAGDAAAPKKAAPATAAGGGAVKSTAESSEDEYRRAATSLIRKSKVPWSSIAGLQQTKALTLQAMNLMIAKRPEGKVIEGWNGILFFGPPGTGKTLMASAIASEREMTFFEVNIQADLQNKFVGDSAKTLHAIYDVAREKQPSIIFMDEITGLASRKESQHEVSHQLHDQFLIELDGMGSKGTQNQVMTIGATNYPWEAEDKVLERFPARIYVPLPDEEARAEIFKLHTTGWGHELQGDLRDLARKTAGYSGRAVKNVCKEAVNRMIADENPWITQKIAGTETMLETRALTMDDFAPALARIKPATSPAEVKKYDDWNAKYGFHATGEA